MTSSCFLGANTAEGFCSHYDTLFSDERIRDLVILKGGPGCGKSTLMRRVSKAAQEKGWDTEEILCSSDPGSLDGVIVPQIALALVDGTAPHVVEPPLCGLGARYLDLGTAYDAAVMDENRDALLDAKAKNAACYPLCYAALRCAGAAMEGARRLALSCLPVEALAALRHRLLPCVLPAGPGRQPVQKRFLSAFTPEGAQVLPPAAETLYVLQDSYGLSAPLLREYAKTYIEAGHAAVLCYHPLQPKLLQGVLLPGLGIACFAGSALFPIKGEPLYDLDALVAEQVRLEDGRRLEGFTKLQAAAVQEALSHLKTAKRHHDALEAACRPAVDFSLVDRVADAVLAGLSSIATK